MAETSPKVWQFVADSVQEWGFSGRHYLPVFGEPLSKNALDHFCIKARDEAGIVADARLHELRYTHTRNGTFKGESLHMT